MKGFPAAMSKQTINITLLLILTFTVTTCFSQDTNLRLLSMGSCELVLSDRDNDLNVYDFGDNPAALHDDQREMWMAAQTWWDFSQGSFRRPFDPKSQFQLHLQAEGVKPMGTKAAFRGFIRYYTEELQNVHRALEYEPYHDIFTPIDTTTGTFDYYGPILGMEYSRRINSWVALGGKILYQLQDGLKRESSKTKVDGRMIHGVVGAYLTPHDQLSVGLTFRPFSVQYRLNANKAYLIDYPIIYKFYGDSLLVKNDKVGTYNRTTRGEGYCSDGVITYHLSPKIIFAGKGGYMLESKKIDEGSSEGKRDIDDYGSWQKQGPWAELACRFKTNFLPLTFGASFNWRSWDSWARTPRYQTVFETMEGGWAKYGIGVAYDKTGSPFKLAAEYHAADFNEEKHNYYQNYVWKRQNNTGLFKCGGELAVSPELTIRFGGAAGEEVAEYHLSFNPVKVQRLSLGTGIILDHIHLDITGFYEKIRPESGDNKRERAMILVQVSQWK